MSTKRSLDGAENSNVYEFQTNGKSSKVSESREGVSGLVKQITDRTPEGKEGVVSLMKKRLEAKHSPYPCDISDEEAFEFSQIYTSSLGHGVYAVFLKREGEYQLYITKNINDIWLSDPRPCELPSDLEGVEKGMISEYYRSSYIIGDNSQEVFSKAKDMFESIFNVVLDRDFSKWRGQRRIKIDS